MSNEKRLTDNSVYVYRNLHTNMWSVRSRKTGRVIAHRTSVYIVNPEFRVGEKGRQRVVSTNVKNVHAGVAGELIDDDDILVQEFMTLAPVRISYDPKKNREFVDNNNNPVDSAAFAKMDINYIDKVRAWGVNTIKEENTQ